MAGVDWETVERAQRERYDVACDELSKAVKEFERLTLEGADWETLARAESRVTRAEERVDIAGYAE